MLSQKELTKNEIQILQSDWNAAIPKRKHVGVQHKITKIAHDE